jgi:type III pantothenate kinase
MSITLCFDFGNTRLKYAVFSGGSLRAVHVLEDASETSVLKALDLHQPERVILSSVVDHDPALEILLRTRTSFHKLDHHSKIPLTTPVGKPETIGADRLALTVAASQLFPGKNILAIGLGSAITYNYVNKYREFIGGSISPGLEMRFRALEAFTAKLPLVKPHWNFPLVGYDTKTNILSGVMLGMAREIDGIADAYQEKYDNLEMLMTGGDTGHVKDLLKKQIAIDPDLIFKGLYAISEYNR